MSSELSSKFSRDDLETLIEAVDDWEMVGNQEFHVLQMVKNAPLPPDDHESYEYVEKIKDFFRQREKEIKASRQLRQEKSVFIKAKLMLIRRDLGIDQLFEMAAEEKSSTDVEVQETPVRRKKLSKEEKDNYAKMLEDAEYFIKDLGVWDHYEKFLKDRKENPTETKETSNTDESSESPDSNSENN